MNRRDFMAGATATGIIANTAAPVMSDVQPDMPRNTFPALIVHNASPQGTIDVLDEKVSIGWKAYGAGQKYGNFVYLPPTATPHEIGMAANACLADAHISMAAIWDGPLDTYPVINP